MFAIVVNNGEVVLAKAEEKTAYQVYYRKNCADHLYGGPVLQRFSERYRYHKFGVHWIPVSRKRD